MNLVWQKLEPIAWFRVSTIGRNSIRAKNFPRLELQPKIVFNQFLSAIRIVCSMLNSLAGNGIGSFGKLILQ